MLIRLYCKKTTDFRQWSYAKGELKQMVEYTAEQRDKVLDDLFAMLPGQNGLVIERLQNSNSRYAVRAFANPAESVESVTVVKFGTGDGFLKDDRPKDDNSLKYYLEQAKD